MKTHTSAQDVAEYLIWLASRECETDPDYLTPMKLQKLLYYVQGWTLAEWKRPMFAEPIEAWRDGPVVPAVFARYKKRETLPIIPEKSDPPEALDAQEMALIRGVWDRYKRHSAYALRDMTHAETPYTEAYAPQDRDGRCSARIETDRIERSFEQRIAEAQARLRSRRARLDEVARANTQKLTGRDAL